MFVNNKNNKRDRILKAAVQIFARKGFYNSKVAEVARQAGVADGTIYLYFKNKDEILISIFEEEMGNFIAGIKSEVFAEEGSVSRLKKFIHTHLQFVRKNPNLAQVFQVELRQSNRFIKEYTGSKLKEYLDVIGTLIIQGQEEGSIRQDIHPGLVKRALFGALDEIATEWVLSRGGNHDLDESAEQVARIFIDGVIAPRRDSSGG